MLLLALLQVIAVQSAAQPAASTAVTRGELPFEVGETLTYDAKVSLFGRVGVAVLRVEAGCLVEDRRALRLAFDVSGGAAFFRVEDTTRSWIDANTLATLRYEKDEFSPLGSHRESASIDPSLQRWEDGEGTSHETAAAVPLDELSLLYYVRTLTLDTGTVDLGAGHFDARRNPIRLRVIGHDTISVPAGRFAVVQLELRVRDPRRYRGAGVIRIDLTDDDSRIPVRIRTSLPGSTPVTLELRRDELRAAEAKACSQTESRTQGGL